MKRNFFVSFCIMGCLLLGTTTGYALPSLSSEDMGEVKVTVDGTQEGCPVIRDHTKRDLFYYVPTRPRLALNNGKPVFHLLKYQRKKERGSSELVEGGILQFAMNMSLPDSSIPGLKREIAARFKVNENKIVVQPLPMKEANLAVYSPTGNLLGDAPQAPQVAPAFASQLIPVQINLTTLGADVYEELCNGNTGVPVVITFGFEGITPACGFKAQMFYHQVHQHFSQAMEVSGSGSIKALGIAAGGGVEQAVEMMIQRKAIRIESLAGEAMTAKQIESYLAIVFEKIMAEVAEVKPPDKVIPANAKAGEPLGLGIGVGYKLKHIAGVKAGLTTVNMTQRLIADRKSICGGFIGIGQYPENVRNTLVTILPEETWQSAFFPMPDPGDASSVGISAIDLTIKIVDKSGKDLGKDAPKSETAKWTAAGGVWMRSGKETISMMFPLMSLYAKFKDRVKDLQFSLDYQITQKAGTKTFVYKGKQLIPMFNGDFPVPSPLAMVDTVAVYCSLDFSGISALATVKADVLVGGKKTSPALALRDNEPQYILMDAPGERPLPIKATVSVQVKKGKPISWTIPDVREQGNTIVFGDWNLEP